MGGAKLESLIHGSWEPQRGNSSDPRHIALFQASEGYTRKGEKTVSIPYGYDTPSKGHSPDNK